MGKHIDSKKSFSPSSNKSSKGISFVCVSPKEIEEIRISSYQYLVE